MPIRVKYVGPLDTKDFRGYFFVRDVTDDASGTSGISGENAIELPDNVANEALKHRNVFMQWNLKVPPEVIALRKARPEAMLKDGTDRRRHWAQRLAVAEMLEADTPRKAQIRLNEIAGAQAEVDACEALIAEANRLKANLPAGLPVAATDVTPAASGELLSLLAEYREALNNVKSENQQMRAELLSLKAHMESDARLTPDEDVSAPSTEEIANVKFEQLPASGEPNPEGFFADIFEPEAAEGAPVATITRRPPGRPGKK